MALFFRRKKKSESVANHQQDPGDVSRETTIKTGEGPRRAAYDLPDDAMNPPEEDYEGEVPELVLPRPKNPRVFVIANQKGGVGKTTTAVNVGMALAMGGLNVLVIDTDPQGNASTALGVDHAPGTPGTYEVLIEDAAIEDLAVRSPHLPNLHVLPAAIELAMAELELVNIQGRENRMKRALSKYIAQSQVDYVIFDCPPSLGLLTLNALVAANEIMVPIQCEYYALEGLTQLLNTINRVKGNLNDDLELTTVLLTMYDGRTNLAQEVAREVRTHFASETVGVEIPRSVRIAEAPSYGESVLTYHPKSPGAIAYLKAAEEIANSVKGK